MELPVIILNCKTYPQMDGEGTLKIARACQEVRDETGVNIIVCPPNIELTRIISEVEIPVLAQNVDSSGGGAKTGTVTLGSVKAAGAAGLLVNHSECRRTLADIEALVSKAKELDLDVVVCTNNVNTSRAAAALGADLVAMEPPELIGGDTSVTSADPDIVRDTVKEVSSISPFARVLTGAGVKTKEDVEMALELGTHGVLLASGVIKAEDPKKVLLSLAEGLKGR